MCAVECSSAAHFCSSAAIERRSHLRYTARVFRHVHRFPPAVALLLLAALFAVSCAPKQKIPLDCVPKDITIYVDKKPLDSVPDEIDLRADRPHTLFFRGEGYEPAMVVLESVDGERGPTLSPSNVCVELHFVERAQEIEVEIER